MRLTLLTLLAYLDNDNHLSPDDAQALKDKIEKSDFASGLVMRIKSISRKLRMSAPKVDGKGLGRDPNSVATYLEGDLPPERLGEFERLCLESDVHLAEVASCHQILSMVLSKPAQVPPAVREKIYGLGAQAEAARIAAPNRIDGPHAPAGDGQPAAPPLPPKPSSAASSASLLAMPSDNGKTLADPGSRREAPGSDPVAPPVARPAEVPDYLRATQSRKGWLLWVAVAAVFLLVLGGLRAMGPFNREHPLARMLGMAPTEVAVVPQPPAPQPNPTPPAPMPPAPMPAPPEQSPVVLPPLPMPPVRLPSDPVPAEPAPPEPMPMPVPKPLPLEPVPGERPEIPPPLPVPPGDKPEVPKPIEPVKPLEPMPLPVPPPVAPAVNPSETVDMGRYTSDEQVLAHLVTDPKTKSSLWYRLAPRTLLVAGERLVVLPTYRPQLTLASGIHATFAGESAFHMERPAQAGGAKMTVEYGRLMLASIGATGGQVELDLAGLKGTIALADADAAVAIEVRRFLSPGARAEDPQAEVVRVVDLFATGGRVVWQPAEGDAIEIPAQHVITYKAEELPRSGGPFEFPAWTDAKSLVDIERRASLDMEAELPLDKSLDIALAEHAGGRRVEVRSLAARSLAALDQFEAILEELNDPRQYSYWAGDIDSLRLAVSRSSQAAAHLLATLQTMRPENARVLFEMLLGASDEQLVGGSAAQLVKSLESNEVDVRVVALDSLRRITGQMLMYRPEKPLASNSTSIQKWKEKLKDNLITNRVPPNPLNEFKAAAPR
jgi:hypothetical protein